MKIALADLHIGKRFRQDTSPEDLIEDWKEGPHKQITPITVRPPTEEERELGVAQPWVLVAGGRRCAAAMLLGWTEIEAFDRGLLTMLDARVMELNENLKRKALPWQDECALKAEILELRKLQNPNLTQGEIAREIGDNVATFSRDVQTHRAIVENPSLAKASTKMAAHGAAKILQAQETRLQTISGQPQRPSFRGDIESKVATADAREWLLTVPERAIDLAVLDGPYGYNYWKSGQKQESGDSHLAEYDDDPERTGDLYRDVFPKIVRAVRETGWIVFFCGEETYDFLAELAVDTCAVHASYRSSVFPKQCEHSCYLHRQGECRFLQPEVPGWTWYRPNSRNNPRYRQLHAKNVKEDILVVNMGKGMIVKWPCTNVLVHDAVYENRVHPNEKPIPLYKDLIERFTFPGDSVLDCFYGSGNSLAAAASLQRDFRGCDLNPTMRQFALARIHEHYQPISPKNVTDSFERYKRNLLRQPEGLEDFSDETEPSGPNEVGSPEWRELFKKAMAQQDELKELAS